MKNSFVTAWGYDFKPSVTTAIGLMFALLDACANILRASARSIDRNKDVGEGLNTAFAKMAELGLKAPEISELENAVLVLIKHEPLASPDVTIMKYLETHETIKNATARQITYVNTDFKMKSIFNRMEAAGMIEKVPGTRTASTAYRKKKTTDLALPKTTQTQLSNLFDSAQMS